MGKGGRREREGEGGRGKEGAIDDWLPRVHAHLGTRESSKKWKRGMDRVTILLSRRVYETSSESRPGTVSACHYMPRLYAPSSDEHWLLGTVR